MRRVDDATHTPLYQDELPFLVTGLLLGVWMVIAQFTGHAPPRSVVTAHVDILLVGFMLMVVMGVATLMFPRPALATRATSLASPRPCTGSSLRPPSFVRWPRSSLRSTSRPGER